jgi:hypothetical protein
MNKFRNSVLGVMLLFVFFTQGCTNFSIPPVAANALAKKVSLNFNDSTIYFSGTNTGNQSRDRADFMSALGYMTRLNLNKPEENGINISAINIQSKLRAGSPFFVSLISTPLFVPFSLIRTRCAIDIKVTYVLTSDSGEEIQKSTSHTIRGSYGGWSFIRYAFRGQVIKRLQAEVPHIAAEMLVEHIQRDGSTTKK